MNDALIVITDRDKPILLLILAALFFSCAVLLLGFFIYFFEFTSLENLIEDIASLLISVSIFIFGGISFSGKNRMYFDLEKNKFKNEFSVGLIKTGKWQDLPPLNYVSVFGVGSKYVFKINLWYGKNEYLKIHTVFGKRQAFKLGYEIARKLGVKLLDATIKNDFKYLDMDVLKKKYK